MHTSTAFMLVLFLTVSIGCCATITAESINAVPIINETPEREECIITAFPSIGIVKSPQIIEEITFPFTMNGTRYTITIPVDKNLYEAAQSGNQDVAFTGPCYSSELYELRWSVLATQPIWNEFYAAITSQLEAVLYSSEQRDKNLVDISEAWIQAIQYRTRNAARTLFPVEVLYERAGDCDDKALLVASLLAYNGYDAAIIEYSGHAVAGVAATDCNGTTGYLFLETTTPQYYTLSDITSETQPILEGMVFSDWYKSAVIDAGFHEPLSVRKIGTGTKMYPGCVDPLYLIQEPQTSEELEEIHALTMRAQYYIAENRYNEALALCNEVLTRDPTYLDAIVLKALIHSEWGEHDEAIKTIESALPLHRDKMQLHETAAILYYAAEDYERALEENTEWLALSDLGDRDERALAHRFTVLVEVGNYTEARETIAKLLLISPGNIEYLAQMGIQSLNVNDFKTANTYFTDVLAKVSRAVDMLLLRGLALLCEGDEDGARKEFHAVGSEDKETYLALYNNDEAPIPFFNNFQNFSELYITFIESDPFSAPIFIERGREEQIKGNVTNAEMWYERAQGADPASSLPWIAIGALYEDINEEKDAELAYLNATLVDKDKATAWYEVGRFYAEQEEYEKAYNSLIQALEIDNAYALAWTLLGDLYYQDVLNDFERAPLANLTQELDSSEELATLAYNRALAADPSLYDVATRLGELRGDSPNERENATVLSAKGLSLLKDGKFEDGVEVLQKAVAIDPSLGDLWFDIGTALEKLQKPREAVAAYEKGLAWNASAETWAGLGSALAASEDLPGAIRAYERATELDENIPENWVKKGNVEYYYGDYAEAVQSYQKSIDHGIPYPDTVSLNIVEALRKADRIEEAVELFKTILKTSPEFKMWWELRFNDLIIETAYDEAVTVLEVAVVLNPESGSAWNNLAVLYPRYDRLDEALGAARKATQYFGECACSWDTLGSVYLHLKRYDDAIDAYNKAIAIDMNIMEAFNNRGIAHFAMDRYEEATSSLEHAAWIQPDAPVSWYNLGVAYDATGQKAKASEAFSKAYELRWNYRELRERMLREEIQPKDQFIVADGWEGVDLIPFVTGSVNKNVQVPGH